MTKSLYEEAVSLGTCYYPEHWDESLWEDDFRRMKELGLTTIRVAEFGWALMEPEEGVFDFSLFERALDAAHRYGLRVILGTPTATPPAWLTHRYPEVLNASADGVLFRHGMRRHYNYNSPIYLELCERITRKMAEHFKDHPSVIGWQIDNELNCEINVFYAEADHAAFRVWLEKRYGTLEALNKAWGAVFWSQTYTAWEQIRLTGPTPSGSPNPHQALDEKRFISDSAIAFAKVQSDVLREVIGDRHWITTNGLFGHLDNHQMTDELLDFFSYDSYPQFSTTYRDDESEPLLDRKWSYNLTNVRSVSPNFCIMEQQSGPGGWTDRFAMPSPKPGQMRLWTYQSLAHGVDMLLYFRWRTATFGTEIYWHGINDYHNQPTRRTRELGQIGDEIARVGAAIAQSRYQASIALVSDYDNDWDGELDKWYGPMAWRSTSAWYKALQYKHIGTDKLTLRKGTTLEELQQYDVLIYPHPAILSEETANLLQAYAEAGGTVIFGARTGYKDHNGHCRMMLMPGYAAALSGITVEEFTVVNAYEKKPTLQWQEETSVAGDELLAEGFNDILQVNQDSVRVLATYASEHYAGKPALTVNTVGKGKVYYYGAEFTDAIIHKLLPELGLAQTAGELLQAPKQVELAVRSHAESGEGFVFVLNYASEAATLQLHKETVDLLSGKALSSGEVELEPYGVMVLPLS